MCVSAANLSAWPAGAAERPFVRAVSLLHSHFCNTETLQEAIIRSAGQSHGVEEEDEEEWGVGGSGGPCRGGGRGSAGVWCGVGWVGACDLTACWVNSGGPASSDGFLLNRGGKAELTPPSAPRHITGALVQPSTAPAASPTRPSSSRTAAQ